MTTEQLKRDGIKIFGDQFPEIARWMADRLVNHVSDGSETFEILEELSLEY